MTFILLKPIFPALLAILFAMIVIFLSGLYGLYHYFSRYESKSVHSNSPIASIAGEDFINTQLDLGRAYIETEKYSEAKKILISVTNRGTIQQQNEASALLNRIS